VTEFVRYFAASALAFLVDVGLYRLALGLGSGYAMAACVGFVAGVALAYMLSVRWAFQARGLTDARAEFLVFALIGLAGLALTEALLWLQIDRLRVDRVLAKVLAAGAVFLFNFGLRKALLFTRRETAGSRRIA
jgi:putative flippase GtrA